MTILELQKEVVDALNGVEELVQGGCMAFAEDERETYKAAPARVAAGKVALVVVTPEMARNGIAQGGIPAETELHVQCSEIPPVAARQRGVMRALDAAEVVMHALDGERLSWRSTRQVMDERTGTLTAVVVFDTTVKLTRSQGSGVSSQGSGVSTDH